MATLSKKDIKRLTEKQKIKLMKFAFETIDEKIINMPYFHEDYPKECELWHEVMEQIDE